MVLLTSRSASAVRNLTLFSHLIHIIARVCHSRHSSARGLPAAGSLCKFLPAVGYALLPAVGPFFSSWVLGSHPWLFFPLSCLQCSVRGTGAATPRAPLTSVRPCFQGPRAPFLTHHVVLNLGFTFGHSSRCSRVLSPHAWCCFTARLVLSPCSFTLLVVLGARPCFQGFPFTARSSNDGLHVLRVVWWSPAPLLFSLPRAARVERYLHYSAACSGRLLAERHHVSLLLKAAFLSGLLRSSTPLRDTLSRRDGRDRTSSTTERYLSSMSLFAPCVKRLTWTVSFFALLRGGQSRMHLNSARSSSS